MFWRDELRLQARGRHESIRVRERVRRANRSPAIRGCFDKRLKSAGHAARKIQVAAGPLQSQRIRISRRIESAAETFEVDHTLQTGIEIGHPEKQFVIRRSLIETAINPNRLFRAQGWITKSRRDVLEDARAEPFEQ